MDLVCIAHFGMWSFVRSFSTPRTVGKDRGSVMPKIRVLFVCIHNSARSLIAEAFLNTLFGGTFEAGSAGLEPGKINPLAVQTMREVGIDISHKEPRDVFEVYKSGNIFGSVITVCDEASAERCPRITKRIHWSFTDPASLVGNEAEQQEAIRGIRETIRQKIVSWVRELSEEFILNSDKKPLSA